MDEGITSELKIEATSSKDLLERLVCEGARNVLQAALEEEGHPVPAEVRGLPRRQGPPSGGAQRLPA